MKYITREIYQDGSDDEFNQKYELWMEEFATIREKLPKRFLKEFDKYHFHDNIIDFFSIERIKTKRSGYKYHLNIKLLDYMDKRYIHDLNFYDIINFKSNIHLKDFAGVSDFIYCEILPADENRFSWEIELFGNDSSMYFDFKKMRYKKIRVNEEPSAKR